MPKFQISGYSLSFAPQVAVSRISGSAYLVASAPGFSHWIFFPCGPFQTAVQTFASGSPDSPRTVSAA
ncbi:MAG: hypothetical protein JO182_26415 [Acidobacteriaceae bacterium]|nr:hypothetical protein [Acidobacteriaceae bacterium]MBV9938289.1 hypothetical protein [Acidobacteriaceae bacterium]